MKTEPNYREIAERIEAGNVWLFLDSPHIMAFLGYETCEHKALGVACRKVGTHRWFRLPKFDSADDALEWLCVGGVTFDDIGRNEDGTWYISMLHPTYGNDYGNASTLGRAMWAAFIRIAGEVGSEDEDDMSGSGNPEYDLRYRD
jgi:hypothetical protein